MKALSKFIILAFVVLWHQGIIAQNCASLNGIINTYAPVSNISGNVVTIGATSGATAPFAVGDYVVLIQMTGIPPVHTGSNMGNYELILVSAVSGSNITLDGITRPYSFSTEKVQLVRAPYCPSATVDDAVDSGDAAEIERWCGWVDSQRGEMVQATSKAFEDANHQRVRSLLNAWRYIERLSERLRDVGGGR